MREFSASSRTTRSSSSTSLGDVNGLVDGGNMREEALFRARRPRPPDLCDAGSNLFRGAGRMVPFDVSTSDRSADDKSDVKTVEPSSARCF